MKGHLREGGRGVGANRDAFTESRTENRSILLFASTNVSSRGSCSACTALRSAGLHVCQDQDEAPGELS